MILAAFGLATGTRHYYHVQLTGGTLNLHVPTEKAAMEIALASGKGELLDIQRRYAWGVGLPRAYYADLLRRMAFHVEVGRSMGSAFLHVVEVEQNSRYRAKLQPAADAVAHGARLSDALGRAGLFDTATLALIDAGEQGKNAAEVLETLAQRYEAKEGTRKVWKAFAVGFVVQAAVAWLTVVWLAKSLLPSMAEKIKDKPSLQSWFDGLIFVADSYVVVLSLLLVGVWMLVSVFLWGQDVMRARADAVLRRIPGVRPLLHDPAMADAFNTAAWAIKAGLRIDQAYALAVSAVSLPPIKELWRTAKERLDQGILPSATFVDPTGLVEHRERLSLSAYQDRKQLAKVFGLIARDRLERSARQAKQALTFYTMAFTITTLGILALAFAVPMLMGEVMSMDLTEAMSTAF